MSLETIRKAANELYPLITNEFSAQSPKKYKDDSLTLAQLDQWTTAELPHTLKSRHEQHKLRLTKDELVLLMDWKLAKGKFRPTLPKLIKSNESQAVADASEEGFGVFIDYISKADPKNWSDINVDDYRAAAKAAMKSLCQLRGVGPATASLMLSLLGEVTPYAPPFFSDESFMYFIRDAVRPSQPIKYNVKEYVDEYLAVLVNLAVSDDVSPIVLEKGGWSLKMYQTYRIDRLADIKLLLEVDDDALDHFDRTSDILDSVEKASPAKRAAPSKSSKAKRVKRES